MPVLERHTSNPVLRPSAADSWEVEAAFNPCVAGENGVVHLVYRAESTRQRVAGADLQLSTVGHAMSTDGVAFEARRLLLRPEHDWEMFGCEDPRITLFEGKYYIFYTALSKHPFRADGIRVGVGITTDFRAIKRHPVTTFNSKAMALFPERVRGKMAAVLTANTDRPPSSIGIALFDFEDQIWSPQYWDRWYASLDQHTLEIPHGPHDHVEVGAPPVLTPDGWLLPYCLVRDYGHPDRMFSVEAVLLDRNDPTKVIGRGHRPMLRPEEPYERFGRVPNTIFPSGARVHGKRFELYYGAADTSSCLASCDLNELLDELKAEPLSMERFAGNPILEPDPAHEWESKCVFNAGVVQAAGRIHLLYRAMGHGNRSVLGYASTTDGFHFDERLREPAYWPRAAFERPAEPGVGSGCEDARLTLLGDRIQMCYTAYDGVAPPRVALSSIALDDFVAHRWAWSEPKLISKPGEMNKDAALFPRKIDGQYAILHRPGRSISLDLVPDLSFDDGRWLAGNVLLDPPPGAPKIGGGGPPIETDAGWLMLYHVISSSPHQHYGMKAAILDLDDPRKVLADMTVPFLEPITLYERIGTVPNVVFSCGQAVLDGKLFMYYGGADRVMALATADLEPFTERIMKEHAVR